MEQMNLSDYKEFTNLCKLRFANSCFMGRDPVELGNERNINHPLCGCAVYVIQKNHLSIYNEVVQAEIINERKGDFNGK